MQAFLYLQRQPLQIFSDVTYSSATFTANAALIYNTTTNGGSGTTDAVCAIAFGGDKTATNGTFTIQFPTADATNAIIRLAWEDHYVGSNQDGVDSPGDKRIGTVMLYLQPDGVQKHGMMVSGEILQTKLFH